MRRPRFPAQAPRALPPAVPPFTCRDYRQGDDASIVAAFNETFGLQLGADYWRWKFAGDADPIATVAVDATGAVQAHLAGMRAQWQGRGAHLSVALGADLFARRDPEVIRNRVMLKTFAAFHRSNLRRGGLQLIYGFPNRTSAGLHNRHVPLFECPDPVRVYRRGSEEPRVRVDRADRLLADWPEPAAADALWQRAAGRYKLGSPRGWHWLTRRFIERPDVCDYRFIGCRGEGGALSSWVVTRRVAGTLWICDLLWDGESADDLNRIDQAIGAQAQALGASETAMWLQGDDEAVAFFAHRHWVDRSSSMGARLAMHVYDPTLDAEQVYARLYLTYADSDFV